MYTSISGWLVVLEAGNGFTSGDQTPLFICSSLATVFPPGITNVEE